MYEMTCTVKYEKQNSCHMFSCNCFSGLIHSITICTIAKEDLVAKGSGKRTEGGGFQILLNYSVEN